MVKHNLVRWKPVKCKSQRGKTFDSRIPDIIEHYYHGTLLSQILNMDKKKPISFEFAINLVVEKQKEAFAIGRIGPNTGQYLWYLNSFIKFISDLGYHIEITGEEFDSYTLSPYYN